DAVRVVGRPGEVQPRGVHGLPVRGGPQPVLLPAAVPGPLVQLPVQAAGDEAVARWPGPDCGDATAAAHRNDPEGACTRVQGDGHHPIRRPVRLTPAGVGLNLVPGDDPTAAGKHRAHHDDDPAAGQVVRGRPLVEAQGPARATDGDDVMDVRAVVAGDQV